MGSNQKFKPLADTLLFTPLRVGRMNLEHRVVMAPCGRLRATRLSEGVWTTNDLTVEYYSQRASKGGLIVTESTPISRLVRQDSSSRSGCVPCGGD